MQNVEEPAVRVGTAEEEAEDAHAKACDMEDGPERSRLIGLSVALDGGKAKDIALLVLEEENPQCQEALVQGYMEGLTRKRLLG